MSEVMIEDKDVREDDDEVVDAVETGALGFVEGLAVTTGDDGGGAETGEEATACRATGTDSIASFRGAVALPGSSDL